MNINKLRDKIIEQEMDVDELAEIIGIDAFMLHYKLRNPMYITIGEAIKIIDVLGLNSDEANDIFLI